MLASIANIAKQISLACYLATSVSLDCKPYEDIYACVWYLISISPALSLCLWCLLYVASYLSDIFSIKLLTVSIPFIVSNNSTAIWHINRLFKILLYRGLLRSEVPLAYAYSKLIIYALTISTVRSLVNYSIIKLMLLNFVTWLNCFLKMELFEVEYSNLVVI